MLSNLTLSKPIKDQSESLAILPEGAKYNPKPVNPSIIKETSSNNDIKPLTFN